MGQSIQDLSWYRKRHDMVINQLQSRGITDHRVLDAMATIPRECFVPESLRQRSYDDTALAIGLDQTISQPYIVGLMTEHLGLTSACEVLEVGTGSGYQTAVLACLVKHVWSVERLPILAQRAQAVLASLGVENVTFVVEDGSVGWPAKRRFDRIMVTAAAPQLPEPLWQQLRPEGRLIAPVGAVDGQALTVYTRGPRDTRIEEPICQVRFVKLLGRYGCHEEGHYSR